MRWRALLHRRARTLGMVLLILTAVCAVLVPRGSPAAPARLVVAERDLPVGHVLGAGDLSLLEASGEGLPRPEEADALRADLLDSQLAVPVRRGEALGHGMTATGEVLRDLPEGLVAVSVRARDPASSELLSPGVLATLMAFSGEGEQFEVEALVLRGPGASGAGGPGAGGSADAAGSWGSASRDGGGGAVLVGVTGEDARRLAAAESGVRFAVHR